MSEGDRFIGKTTEEVGAEVYMGPMDLMVDIETMSTHNTNALVLSVATVRFPRRPPRGVIITALSSELWVLDPTEQLAAGRHVDPNTQKFWKEQTEKARDHWVNADTCSIERFKTEFELALAGGEYIWANGILFDLGNIASFWDTPPWKYNAPRDLRTIRRCVGERDDAQSLVIELTPHDPISDCLQQIHDLWQRPVTID